MRYFIIFLSVFLMIVQGVETIHSENIIRPGNNSIDYTAQLTSEIVRNPSGGNVPLYTAILMNLAPAVGRSEISGIFRKALNKLESESGKNSISGQILKLSIDDLDGNYSESKKNFSIIKKWNISGPWSRYGKADIDYEFQPERVYKLKDMEKMKNISTDDGGLFYSFKPDHGTDETVYAVTSFTCSGYIVLWIISDAEYKLTVNGKEITKRKGEGKSIMAFALSGAGGYTVQLKAQSGDKNHHPYIRGLITDENFIPAQISYSSNVFNYSFTSEKILTSGESDSFPASDASVSTLKMKELISSGKLNEGYKLGVLITEKFPAYFDVYREFIPLLDIMNREDEFHACMAKFRNIFPDSDIYNIWLADFYLTRNSEKFMATVKLIPAVYMPEELAASYVYMLCDMREYAGINELRSFFKNNPRFRYIFSEVTKLSGNDDLWRSTLIEGSSRSDDEYYYYNLGLAEMHSGVDPVMYWEKGYSLNEYSGLMRDLSDIYENGILDGNDFYKGFYTDFHPEFRWYEKKRKITLHVFESGRVVIEGEDIIPRGSKLHSEKYINGGSEFSSGEILTGIPRIKGIKVLYVVKARDGLPVSVNFATSLTDKKRITVKYKSDGDEEFSVIKYTGEYTQEPEEIFNFINELTLKAENEVISELNYEVICYGDLLPGVFYKNEEVSSVKYSDGLIRFIVNKRFSRSEKERVSSKISKFSSERNFAEWYKKISDFTGQFTAEKNTEFAAGDSFEKKLKSIHFYVMSEIIKSGNINLRPDKIERVLSSGKGTVEEKTHLAKAILEKLGIKSYISFIKSGSELINKILLYVPENKNSGYWLDFSGEGFPENIKPGYIAFVITGDGCIALPVNPVKYIR